MGLKDVDWFLLTQNTNLWWVFVSTVMNLQAPLKGGELLYTFSFPQTLLHEVNKLYTVECTKFLQKFGKFWMLKTKTAPESRPDEYVPPGKQHQESLNMASR